MKPAFALHLDLDRITLLHRSVGGWARLGAVRLDAPDLDGALADLHAAAADHAAGAVTCKIVLPPSQILYREVAAPGPDARNRRQQIRAALDGMTPYAVDDLVFDWSGTGARVQIAIVACETLEEAEDFAVGHRFGPVSFVASPAPGQFAGEPFFGQTRVADRMLTDGDRVLRDNDPVALPASMPDGIDAPGGPAANKEVSASELAADTAPEKAVTSGRIDTSTPTSPPPTETAAKFPVDLAANPVGMSAPLSPDPNPSEGMAASVPAVEDVGAAAADARVTDEPVIAASHPAPTAAQIMARAPSLIAAPDIERPAQPSIASPWQIGWKRAGVAAVFTALIAVGVVSSLSSWPRVGTEAEADAAVNVDRTVADAVSAAPAPTDAPAPNVTTDLPRRGMPPPQPPADRSGFPANALDPADAGHASVTTKAARALAAVGPVAPRLKDGLPVIGPVASPRPSDPPLGADHTANRLSSAAVPSPGPSANATWANTIWANTIWDSVPERASAPGTQPAGDIRLAAIDVQIDPYSLLRGDAARLIQPTGPDAAQPAPAPPGQPLVTQPVLPPAQTLPSGAAAPAADPTRPGAGEDRASADPALAGLRPRARPEGLVPPPVEVATVVPAPATLRPRARPQERIADLAADLAAEAAVNAAAASAAASAAALAASPEPAARPPTLAAVQGPSAPGPAGPNIGDDAEPEVARRAPRIPTSASVAQRATIKDGIAMRDINLIGVFGSSADRRALVRMPNGNMLRVRVGDRIDGGRVAVIDQSRLIYVKGGQNHVLEIPKG